MNATDCCEELRRLQDRADLGVDDPRSIVVRRPAPGGVYHRRARDANLRAFEPHRVRAFEPHRVRRRVVHHRRGRVLVVKDTADDPLAAVAVGARPDLYGAARTAGMYRPVALARDECDVRVPQAVVPFALP